jgi:hypothetical protein
MNILDLAAIVLMLVLAKGAALAAQGSERNGAGVFISQFISGKTGNFCRKPCVKCR